VYRLDRAVRFKHIESLRGTFTNYRSKTVESCATEAACCKEEQRKRSHHDLMFSMAHLIRNVTEIKSVAT